MGTLGLGAYALSQKDKGGAKKSSATLLPDLGWAEYEKQKKKRQIAFVEYATLQGDEGDDNWYAVVTEFVRGPDGKRANGRLTDEYPFETAAEANAKVRDLAKRARASGKYLKVYEATTRSKKGRR